MRILFVSYLHPIVAAGGAQQVAYELFQTSRAQGHDAFLLAALEADHETHFGKPGAPIAPLHGEKHQFLFFPQHYDFVHQSVGDWRSVHFFAELVAKVRPDVIHFHHYHRIGVECLRAARNAAPDATLCLTFHEMMAICMADGQMLKRPSRDLCHAASALECHRCFPDLRPEFISLRKARLQAMLAECDHFIFPSEFLADRYVDWGLPHDKCAVIPNGLVQPSGPVRRQQHSPQVNRFGFFGQFIDNKGVDIILDALIRLSREKRVPACGIELDINGGNKHYATPAYLERVNAQIEEIGRLGVGPIVVRDRGRYSRDQLAERMASIDWVLVPSTWWEVFGLVASEAWMFGRPVIASAIGGLGPRITDGVDGLTVPARDGGALANLMATLPGNPRRWQQLHAGITRPWSDADMFQAHMDLWAETPAQRGAAAPHSNVAAPRA